MSCNHCGCNLIRIHVNKYNSIAYDHNQPGSQQKRNEFNPGSCKHHLLSSSLLRGPAKVPIIAPAQ